MSMVHGKVVDALEIDPAVVKVATEVVEHGWFFLRVGHHGRVVFERK